LDAYKFNLLRNKQMFINQINNGTIAVRRIDEDGMDEQSGMNFTEFVAILSGNTDLLNKAKLDNKIMQLEKEQGIFKKERGRAERKIEQHRADIEKGRRNIERMDEDLHYVSDYEGERIHVIQGLAKCATEKEIAQTLHGISRKHRKEGFTAIGTYIGLRLMVKSEYNLAEGFDRNTFFVEGKSGLKYRYGISGALPLSYADTVLYPKATLEKLPTMIEQLQSRINQMESELPTLQEIVSRKWTKTEELARLKQERRELQQRIDGHP